MTSGTTEPSSGSLYDLPPDLPVPVGDGAWDAIPRVRGTPQSCAFRDRDAELTVCGALIAVLSAQPSEAQEVFAARERLPFPLLSDPELRLGAALALPTFEFGGIRLYRRVTLALAARTIERVFYPVVPPDRNAQDVLAWLRARPVGG